MNTQLHLVHLPVDLPALARFAAGRNRGVVSYRNRRDGRERDAGLDEGRALHHALDETFGPGALRPFRLMPAPGARKGSLYAYSRRPEADLARTARETAPPEALKVLDLDQLSGRDVPVDWPVGRRLGFDIRVRPVVRISSALSDPRNPEKPYQAGAELDAYLVEAQRRFPADRPRLASGGAQPSGMEREARTREAVYRDWLAARLGPAGEIDPASVRLTRFERTRVARQGHAPEGPDATLVGEFVVKDPVALGVALANGIGRHKSYGYGMLLLRPARGRAVEAL